MLIWTFLSLLQDSKDWSELRGSKNTHFSHLYNLKALIRSLLSSLIWPIFNNSKPPTQNGRNGKCLPSRRTTIGFIFAPEHFRNAWNALSLPFMTALNNESGVSAAQLLFQHFNCNTNIDRRSAFKLLRRDWQADAFKCLVRLSPICKHNSISLLRAKTVGPLYEFLSLY